MKEESNWVTGMQLRKELEEQTGKKISRQRLYSWKLRDRIKWKVVYDTVILFDKTSLQIDLEKDLEED